MANKKEIDYDQLEKLLALQCTLVEVSAWFGVSEDTIERRVKEKYEMRFAELSTQKKVGGQISLKRKAFQMAMAGDKTLMIFLLKNWCGYADQNQIVSENVNWTVSYDSNRDPDEK